MSADYHYGSGLTRIQGCIEQPDTRIERSESGLETLTFSFRGEPANIFDLIENWGPGTIPPIVGRWSNFRVIDCRVTQNDGVWATAEFMAKGLSGAVPPPNVQWSKEQKTLNNVTFSGKNYRALYYLAPTTTISRCQLIESGALTPPTPSNPEFGASASVQLLTLTGYVDAQIPGALRSCTSFRYAQSGIYWEIQEVYEITIPQPSEGSEFTFAGSSFTITGFYAGPNFTSQP